MGLLREHIETDYPQFTGKTLEHYFQAKAMQSGRYTMIGNWWDRRGENEIDIVALNEFDKTGMVAEIKRNGKKLDAAALDKKILMLPPEFSLYRLKASLLCMDDM